MFLNSFDILFNTYFGEHLPEDGHNRCPKHVGGYTVHNTINLHICACTCGFSHTEYMFPKLSSACLPMRADTVWNLFTLHLSIPLLYFVVDNIKHIQRHTV